MPPPARTSRATQFTGSDRIAAAQLVAAEERAPDAIAAPHPYLASLSVWRPGSEDERFRPKAMGTMEAFIIFIKAALLSGLILFSPLIFRELWMFVAAGLYPHERRYVYIFLPFSVLLFISGALLAFFAAFPPVLHFLLAFNDWLGIPPEMRISEWLSFVLFLPLAFGLGFQLPLVMLFLNRIGLVSVAAYWRGTRLAILVIFVAAPILNPSPDPYSMLLLALPMTMLYFLGILLCQYASRRHPPASAASAASDRAFAAAGIPSSRCQAELGLRKTGGAYANRGNRFPSVSCSSAFLLADMIVRDHEHPVRDGRH